MITIHKYQFPIADDVAIKMPERARVLSVQVQNGIPTLWAMVETDWKKEERKFKVYGTGHELNGLDLFRTHIGTIQLNGLVWHIFE
jgi:hypothetical protein